MELRLYDTLTREKRPSSRSIPTTCACMSAGRRSMTSPISAMRARSSCSTCCSGCCGTSMATNTSPMSATSPTSTTRSTIARCGIFPACRSTRRSAKSPRRPRTQFHADVAALGSLAADVRAARHRLRAAARRRQDRHGDADPAIDRARPCLSGRRRSSVRHPVDAGLRRAVRPQARRATGRRARRGRRAQEKSRRFRAVEAIVAATSPAGTARGAGDGRAGTSSARR